MTNHNKIEVVAAIFINDKEEVFCARRKNTGDLALKWEFPGGKIEEGESHSEALIREIKEELDVVIIVNDFFLTIDHEYDNFSLKLHSYLCSIASGSIFLHEHEECDWIHYSKLDMLDWANADMPIVEMLLKSR